MSRSLSRRTMIIASLLSLVMCVVMWRMTQSSLQRPLYPMKKSVPLLSSLDESVTRNKGNTTTQHTTLLTDLTILPTEVYVEHEKSLQWLSIPEYDTMPFSEYLKKKEKLLKGEWMSSLYTFLQTLDKSISPHEISHYKHTTILRTYLGLT